MGKIHDDIPIETILKGIDASNEWSGQQEGMLKRVMEEVAEGHKATAGGTIVGPDGSSPKRAPIPDRFLFELILEALRLLLQSERMMRLGMGTILEGQMAGAHDTMKQAVDTVTRIRKEIRANKPARAVWLCDGVLRHWRGMTDKQEREKAGKLGDEGGSKSPDLKQVDLCDACRRVADGCQDPDAILLCRECTQKRDRPGSGPQGSHQHGSPDTPPAAGNPLSGDGADAS